MLTAKQFHGLRLQIAIVERPVFENVEEEVPDVHGHLVVDIHDIILVHGRIDLLLSGAFGSGLRPVRGMRHTVVIDHEIEEAVHTVPATEHLLHGEDDIGFDELAGIDFERLVVQLRANPSPGVTIFRSLVLMDGTHDTAAIRLRCSHQVLHDSFHSSSVVDVPDQVADAVDDHQVGMTLRNVRFRLPWDVYALR